jgi:predicted nucleotide-binding protein (sugar kinase/HSP70/actin superfamily)
VENGVKKAVDDICLPVKLTFGHVMDLADRVDYLFIPRLVSLEPDAFTCPKIIGLPDMIKANLEDIPPVLDTCFDLKKGGSLYQSFQELGRNFTHKTSLIKQAFEKAEIKQREFEKVMEQGLTPLEAIEVLEKSLSSSGNNLGETPPDNLKIALIGHPYNLYDDYINMSLIDKLRQRNCRVITAEMLPAAVMNKESSAWNRDIFWTLGRRMVGAACHFFKSEAVDGIISCISFECGPDSLLQVLIEEEAGKHKEIPYMSLIIDEHTGDAGIVTRIEAFLDMIRRKQLHKKVMS